MSEVDKLTIELVDYSSGSILASKVYKEKKFDKLWSESYYYKLLERACTLNRLIRLAKGIYCFPILGRITTYLSDDDIVEIFTSYDNGMEVGEKMFHDKGVMFYEHNSRTVYTSQMITNKMTINGIQFIKHDIEYYSPYKETIAMLEVLANYNKMGTVDHTMLQLMYSDFCRIYNDDIAREVIDNIGYPKATISFLRMILDSFSVPNTLGDMLSPRSVYKHPTIDEINKQSDWDRRNLRRRVIR